MPSLLNLILFLFILNRHAKCMAAASLQNLLNQDVRSSSGDTLNRDKEVINMENTGLEYLIAEGTNDETKPVRKLIVF